MTKIDKKMKIAASLLVFAVFVSACGAAAPAEPTQDPNAVFTQVAETVMVSMTQTAQAMPPTPTPQPTATIAPTIAVPTAAAVPTQGVPTLPVGPTATIQKYGDSARWLSTNPSDGSVLKGGEYRQVTVCLLNDGTTTWTASYYLEWVGGYRLWNDTKYFYIDADESVDPGEKWCFTMPAVPPEAAG